MRVIRFKYSFPVISFLSASVVVLLIASFFLYSEKNKAQYHNRVLIIQNDSILSENIKLRNASIQQQVSTEEEENYSLQLSQ